MKMSIKVALALGILLAESIVMFVQANDQRLSSNNGTNTSLVEQVALNRSKRELQYEKEQLTVIEVDSIPALAKLAVLRFIEFVAQNPTGVVCLPTGKQAQHFINYYTFYKDNWDSEKVREEIASLGLKIKKFPDTSQLRLVQASEIFPIDQKMQKSNLQFIQTVYKPLLNLNADNMLLIDNAKIKGIGHLDLGIVFPNGQIDVSLIDRSSANTLEIKQRRVLRRINAFCRNYERTIQEWGGINFFLTNLSPDGSIAGNTKGQPHDSITRLVNLNYETAALVAGNFGGIDHTRGRAMITIGLDTILRNPDAQVIVMAMGEGIADIVAQSTEGRKSLAAPVSVLHGLPHARLYVTRAAASKLKNRAVADLHSIDRAHQNTKAVLQVIYDVSFKTKKPILSLSLDDFCIDERGSAFADLVGDNVHDILQVAYDHVVQGLEDGLALYKNKSVVHTSPHHDDIMLSYYPYAQKLLSDNSNYFVYLTSGYNAVTNDYIRTLLDAINEQFLTEHEDEIFGKSNQYEPPMPTFDLYSWMVFVKACCKVFNVPSIKDMLNTFKHIRNLIDNVLPGGSDNEKIKALKGYLREGEANKLWARNHVAPERVLHFRSTFYGSSFLNIVPALKQDAKPLAQLFVQTKPDIVTVAFDPEGTGPDTHYKVLQVVAQALQMTKNVIQPTVIGYRNVWYRFSIPDTTLMIPVSAGDLQEQHNAFVESFTTQKNAPFPAHDYDGPFSALSIRIQRDQLQKLRYLLGEEFFLEHPDERMRNAAGITFLKSMDLAAFLQEEDFVNTVKSS